MQLIELPCAGVLLGLGESEMYDRVITQCRLEKFTMSRITLCVWNGTHALRGKSWLSWRLTRSASFGGSREGAQRIAATGTRPRGTGVLEPRGQSQGAQSPGRGSYRFWVSPLVGADEPPLDFIQATL